MIACASPLLPSQFQGPVSGCLNQAFSSVFVLCVGSEATLALFPAPNCAGDATFKGTSASGVCAPVSTLGTSYTVYCGAAPTPSPQPPLWQEWGRNGAHSGVGSTSGASVGLLAWTTAIPNPRAQTFGGPVIDGQGVVYAGGLALDPATGNMLWQRTDLNLGLTGTCALSNDGTLLYCGQHNGDLCALYTATGKTAWVSDATNFGPGPYATRDDVDIIVSPTGLVISGTANQGVYALDGISGATVWNASLSQRISYVSVNSAPALSPVSPLVYVSVGPQLYALDLATGAEVWVKSLASPPNGYLTAPSVSASGIVYVGMNNATGSAFLAVSGDTGNVLWRYEQNDGCYGSAAIGSDGTVYFAGSPYNHTVVAVNGNTGALLWSYTLAAAVMATPVLDSAGLLYISVNTHTVGSVFYCLNASSGAFEWSYPIMNSLGGPVAVGNGRVYTVAWEGFVYGFK